MRTEHIKLNEGVEKNPNHTMKIFDTVFEGNVYQIGLPERDRTVVVY